MTEFQTPTEVHLENVAKEKCQKRLAKVDSTENLLFPFSKPNQDGFITPADLIPLRMDAYHDITTKRNVDFLNASADCHERTIKNFNKLLTTCQQIVNLQKIIKSVSPNQVLKPEFQRDDRQSLEQYHILLHVEAKSSAKLVPVTKKRKANMDDFRSELVERSTKSLKDLTTQQGKRDNFNCTSQNNQANQNGQPGTKKSQPSSSQQIHLIDPLSINNYQPKCSTDPIKEITSGVKELVTQDNSQDKNNRRL